MRQQAMIRGGIYIVRCSANNGAYVGQSADVQERFHQHRCCLRRGNHPNPYLQAAWKKYGESSFAFEVATLEDNPQKRDELEDIVLIRLKAEGIRVFNIRSASASNRGVKYSPEAKAKLKQRAVQQFATAEARAKHSQRYRESTDPYVLTDASGTIQQFDNPACFAGENGLELGNLHKLLKGALYSYRGWTNPSIDSSAKKTCKLSTAQKLEAVRRHLNGETYRQIAESLGVTHGSLGQIVRAWNGR
jgi:group I intron endonuclease